MASDLRALPRRVEAIGDGFLGIIWADGHESVYPAEYLRHACPCASCNERRRETPARAAAARGASLPVIGQVGAGAPVTFDQHEPVGRYALRFSWSDRHDTGIFTFELLRALCPCEACEAARPKPER